VYPRTVFITLKRASPSSSTTKIIERISISPIPIVRAEYCYSARRANVTLSSHTVKAG
jgi:hypothetical protein